MSEIKTMYVIDEDANVIKTRRIGFVKKIQPKTSGKYYCRYHGCFVKEQTYLRKCKPFRCGALLVIK